MRTRPDAEGSSSKPSAQTALVARSVPAPGSRIEVFWPVDDVHYPGVVQGYDPDGLAKVLYDDDDVEMLNLQTERWRPERRRAPGKSPRMPHRTPRPTSVADLMNDTPVVPTAMLPPQTAPALTPSVPSQSILQQTPTAAPQLSAADIVAGAASAASADATPPPASSPSVAIATPEPQHAQSDSLLQASPSTRGRPRSRGRGRGRGRGRPKKATPKRPIGNSSPTSNKRGRLDLVGGTDIQMSVATEEETVIMEGRDKSIEKPSSLNNATTSEPRRVGRPRKVTEVTLDGTHSIASLEKVPMATPSQLRELISPLQASLKGISSMCKLSSTATTDVTAQLKNSTEAVASLRQPAENLDKGVKNLSVQYAMGTSKLEEAFKAMSDKIVPLHNRMEELAKAANENTSALSRALTEIARVVEHVGALEKKIDSLGDRMESHGNGALHPDALPKNDISLGRPQGRSRVISKNVPVHLSVSEKPTQAMLDTSTRPLSALLNGQSPVPTRTDEANQNGNLVSANTDADGTGAETVKKRSRLLLGKACLLWFMDMERNKERAQTPPVPPTLVRDPKPALELASKCLQSVMSKMNALSSEKSATELLSNNIAVLGSSSELEWFTEPSEANLEKAKGNYASWTPPLSDWELKAERAALSSVAKRVCDAEELCKVQVCDDALSFAKRVIALAQEVRKQGS